MFGIDLLNMTNKEIDDMCEVVKFLSRPSLWKILRSFLQHPRSPKTRKELLKVAELTNVTKDKNFLVENDFIIEEGTYYKSYYLKYPEKFNEIIQNIHSAVFEFKNKRYYRN